MTDDRKVRPYFKAKKELEKFFRKMLEEKNGKKKHKWTRQTKKEFEETWKNFCKAYDKHEKRC